MQTDRPHAERISRILLHSARYLRERYYNPNHGWDTREIWTAHMFLLMEAHRLLDEPFIYTMDACLIDPYEMIWWKHEFGRAERLASALMAAVERQSQALATFPVVPKWTERKTA